MSVIARFSRKLDAAFKTPGYASVRLFGQLMPSVFRRRYVQKAKQFGVNEKYLVLSFDCDTEKDIRVVENVHQRLGDMSIIPSYAVPGELLAQGAGAYRDLFDAGAEFINHGYVSHTTYTEATKTYLSTVFYNELTDKEVRDDIVRGHQTCGEVLGKVPEGFRTPHFGTYQQASQLKHLYAVLAELGYKFSSSTTPENGMWHGPIKRVGKGLVELPVTGCFDYPCRILDSWSFRFSPSRQVTELDYVDQFNKIVEFLSVQENVGVLNVYADPSQVYDWPGFFECMALAGNFKKVSFSQLVDEVCG